MVNYTLGFIFNEDLTKVLLIKFPERGKWNDNLLNGIGGHIENNESQLNCMIRETKEETDIHITHWKYAGVYDGSNFTNNEFKVFTFFTFIKEVYGIPYKGEEGETNWYNIEDICKLKTVPNTQWMIPFCLSKLKEEIHGTFNVNYIDNKII